MPLLLSILLRKYTSMRYVYDDSETPSISAFKFICFIIDSSRCTWSLMYGRFSILFNFRLSSAVNGTDRMPNFRISDGNTPSHRTDGTANDSAKFDIDCKWIMLNIFSSLIHIRIDNRKTDQWSMTICQHNFNSIRISIGNNINWKRV